MVVATLYMVWSGTPGPGWKDWAFGNQDNWRSNLDTHTAGSINPV